MNALKCSSRLNDVFLPTCMRVGILGTGLDPPVRKIPPGSSETYNTIYSRRSWSSSLLSCRSSRPAALGRCPALHVRDSPPGTAAAVCLMEHGISYCRHQLPAQSSGQSERRRAEGPRLFGRTTVPRGEESPRRNGTFPLAGASSAQRWHRLLPLWSPVNRFRRGLGLRWKSNRCWSSSRRGRWCCPR